MARVLTGIGLGEVQTRALILSNEVEWPGGDGYVICEFLATTAATVVVMQTKTQFNVGWIDTDIVFENQLDGIKYFTLPRAIQVRLSVQGPPGAQIIAQCIVDPRRRTLA